MAYPDFPNNKTNTQSLTIKYTSKVNQRYEKKV